MVKSDESPSLTEKQLDTPAVIREVVSGVWKIG